MKIIGAIGAGEGGRLTSRPVAARRQGKVAVPAAQARRRH